MNDDNDDSCCLVQGHSISSVTITKRVAVEYVGELGVDCVNELELGGGGIKFQSIFSTNVDPVHPFFPEPTEPWSLMSVHPLFPEPTEPWSLMSVHPLFPEPTEPWSLMSVHPLFPEPTEPWSLMSVHPPFREPTEPWSLISMMC